MAIADFVSELSKSNATAETTADIITFCEAPWGLRMSEKAGGSTTLRPVQKVILKCYYNLPLDTKEKVIIVRDHLNEVERYRFTEAEYLEFLYNEGRSNIKEPVPGRNELVLVAGRRGGKSKIGALVCAYEAYRLIKNPHPQKYYGITDNAEIQLTTIATSTEQSEILFNDIASYIDSCQYFDKYK